MGRIWKWLTTWSSDPIEPQPSTPKAQAPTKPIQDQNAALQQLIETVSLPECIRAYVSAVGGSPVERLAIDKVKKLARTFEDWMLVYGAISPVSVLGNYAFEQLPLTAVTFDDWQRVYLSCSSNGPRSEAALQKMAAIAHSREEQVKVYNLAPEGSQMEQSMFAALKLQAKTLDEWETIYDSSEGELRRFAAGMMVDLAPNDVSVIDSLLSHDPDDADLKDRSFAKIRSLSLPLSDWIDVVNDVDISDRVRNLAMEKVVHDPEMAAKNFDELVEILGDAEDDSEFEKYVADLLVAKAPQDDPAKIVGLLEYSLISDDDELRARVFQRLRTAATTFEVWKDIYESTEDEDAKAIARDGMIDCVGSADMLIELDDAIGDDKDDEYDERVAPKIATVLRTEAECRIIVDKYYADSVLFEGAFKNLLGLATTMQECLDLFLSLLDEWKTEDDEVSDKLVGLAVDKLLSVATPGEIYITSKLGGEFDVLGERAQSKIDAQSQE